MGYVTPISCAARRTLSMLCSKENSGVCAPITTRPCSAYLSAHARTYGSWRSQLTHVYVQKLTSTTLPRRPAVVSGAELSQSLAPSSCGILPSAPSSLPTLLTLDSAVEHPTNP